MTDKSGLLGLPNSWEVVKLGEFVKSEKGKKPINLTKNKNRSNDIPYIDIQAFEKGIYEWWTDGTGCRFCTESDFLMVWDGSRSGLVGKGVSGALGSTLIRINFPSIFNQYAYYFLLSKYQEINTRTKGSGTPHVDPSLLWNYEFPVPPINEQKRIVAKIEALFSELDKGIEALKTAREQLKVYRQSVLKHAFEGKLTAQWREENKDKLESPEQLLARIQQERESCYQQQLEEWQTEVKKWEEEGREGRKPGKPTKPSIIDVCKDTDLHELPESWIWIEYGKLCERVRNGISKKPDDKGEKIFRISAVRPMELVIDDVRYIDNTDHQYDSYYLKNGDLIFTRYNGSRAYVGVCAEYNGDETHLFPDKLIQTRIGTNAVSSSYLEKALNCGESRKFVEKRIRTTAGQSEISGSDIKAIPVPICSYEEQIKIGQAISEELSRIDKMLDEINISLKHSETLRQSILKKAFSGQLVTQDPNDEPASVLLERIRAEKAAQTQTGKTSGQRKTRRKVAV
ncbi:MAG: restriction endonuclease subunit S [Gammaproteobacteria bacterium]